MAWIYLIIAGLLEVVWASLLKKTDGFTRLGPSLLTIGVMCVSFYLLGVALKTLPTGTGYAVWVGIGAVGTALRLPSPTGQSNFRRPNPQAERRWRSCPC